MIDETTAFYEAHAESFAGTRERPWEGWERVLELCKPKADRATLLGIPYRVLDIGCGNMRFERMLADALPNATSEFFAIDNCAPLARDLAQEEAVSFAEMDVMLSLERGSLTDDIVDAFLGLHRSAGNAPFDLAVAFGFMHHIPIDEWRRRLIASMAASVKSGGIAVVALWRFASNAKLAAKAANTTEAGCAKLGIRFDQAQGDYLLGWQGGIERIRYCHSFSDDEASELVRYAKTLDMKLISRFYADGPDGESNLYLCFERREQGV